MKMTCREFQQIDATDKEILQRFLNDYPVRLGQLATNLGVAINISNMETGVSGQIKRENGNYTIRVNRNEARERQRFTVAHELSHYLLHREIIDNSPDGITDTVLYRSGKPERIEFEANRLAADIVMPMPLVERLLRDEFGGVVTEATIESLASRFQVSKAAMEIRLSTFVEA
jgi:Zn-dependent peptidase ImmA (M78 family)